MRELSLTEAAGRAGLSKAALSQWENWSRVPSGESLDKLLKVYEVDFRTRAKLLTAADPQYAKYALHENPIGPAIDIGQVLKGLRLRNGVSQAELASRLGLNQSSVTKWETGETLPTEESLHAALFALHANQTEVEAILRSEFKVESSQEREERILSVIDLPFELQEMALILLQYDFWHEAVRSSGYHPAYQLVTYIRGLWCASANRDAEAAHHFRHALALAKEAEDWNSAACSAVMLAHTWQELAPWPEKVPMIVKRARQLRKWLDFPLSGMKKAVFLGEYLWFEYQDNMDAHERGGKDMLELIQAHAQDRTYYLDLGIDCGIYAVSANAFLRGFHDKAFDLLQTAPGYAQRGYFSTPALTRCTVEYMIEMNEFTPDVIPAIDRVLDEYQHRPGDTVWYLRAKKGILHWQENGKFKWILDTKRPPAFECGNR